MEQMSLFDVFVTSTLETKAPQTTNWILVDGNNLLCRAYYATAIDSSKIKKNSKGQAVNGINTAIRMLLNYQKNFNAPIAVFFDEGKGFRKKLYPAYKDGRGEQPAELTEQFPLFHAMLASAEIPYFMDPLLEADDLIASACATLKGHKYVISNDKDLTQLIDDEVTVVVRKGKSDIHYTPEVFVEENGIEPIQIIDLKALEGDSSDNIPGVSGIGKKGAMDLVKAFGSIENIPLTLPKELKKYQNKLDDVGRNAAVFYKDIVTLRNTSPVPLLRYEVNRQALARKCEELELYSIVNLLRN